MFYFGIGCDKSRHTDTVPPRPGAAGFLYAYSALNRQCLDEPALRRFDLYSLSVMLRMTKAPIPVKLFFR